MISPFEGLGLVDDAVSPALGFQQPSSGPSVSSSCFKEFKWYNSSHVHLEVQCAICRLEVPIDMSVDSADIPEEIYISSQIICNQLPLHETPVSTHYATIDKLRNALVWDYVLSFPVKIRELSLNAVLVITAFTPDGTPFGGTTMRFFNDSGCLKRGKQKLIFYFGRVADPNVIISENLTPGNLYELYRNWDYSFSMEKVL